MRRNNPHGVRMFMQAPLPKANDRLPLPVRVHAGCPHPKAHLLLPHEVRDVSLRGNAELITREMHVLWRAHELSACPSPNRNSFRLPSLEHAGDAGPTKFGASKAGEPLVSLSKFLNRLLGPIRQRDPGSLN